MKMARDLDVILFGATGFTGKHTVPTLSKFAKSKQLTWGIAGRSEKKLRGILKEYEKEIEMPLNEIPVIVADVKDEKSLTEVARRTRIVINCCGPYRFYGEPMVKACVEQGTHHVDVNGEPHFMEKMQLKYHDQAREKGVYIISACGFDSIPADLGVVFLQQKFDGVLNSVVTYLQSWEEGEGLPGPAVSYGTWESVVYGRAHAHELGALRQQLFPNKLPSLKPKLKLITRPHKNEVVEGWTVPFPGADRSVLERSQRNFYEIDKQRPIQIETYFIIQSFWNIIKLIFFGGIFQLLVKFKCGTNLLLKHPSFFSGGFFSNESPSEEKIERQHFSVTLYGEGWKEKLSKPEDQYATLPDKAMCVKVKGRNPAYGSTCVCLVLSALTIITETDKMPSSGGVYTPGYAFAKTSLIEKLNENEVSFEVLFEKDLISRSSKS